MRWQLKPIIGFEIWFSLIFAVVMAPFTAWLVDNLLISNGKIAVSNEDILSFFISLRGALFIVLSASFFIGLAFWEWIGLMVISLAAAEGRVISVSRVLGEEAVHFWSVIRLGMLQAFIYFLAGLPFLAAAVLTYFTFLAEHDISYYLSVKPWQLWIALFISAIIGGSYLLLGAWLYIRWLFAIPALIFENARPIEALRKSWRRTRHRVIELAVPQAVWWIFILIASSVTALVLKAVFTFVLVHAGLNLYVILPVAVLALGAILITQLVWFILGKNGLYVLNR